MKPKFYIILGRNAAGMNVVAYEWGGIWYLGERPDEWV